MTAVKLKREHVEHQCRPQKDAYDVVIVGAGHNGLVTAFYLAQAGRSVAVLERRPIVGGACVTEELLPGARFSTCASILWQLQPRVEDDLELHRHGLRYERLPGSVALFPDGEYLFLSKDKQVLIDEITRLNPQDGQRLDAWLEFWSRAASLVHPFFLKDPPTVEGLRAHAQRVGAEDVLAKLITSSTGQICDEFFQDERVKASLVSVEDVGPASPGGALVEAWWHTNIYNRVSASFPRGGMGAVTEAMARAARGVGAVIITDAEVTRIVRDGAAVSGVELADGRRLASPIVVSNADPKHTLALLVGESTRYSQPTLPTKDWTTKVGYQKFHGILRALPDLSDYFADDDLPVGATASIRIAPSLQTYREAYDAALAGQLPDVPVIGGMFIPSIYDDTLAPGGMHTASAWVLYAPGAEPGSRPEGESREAGRRFISRVTEFIPNFEHALADWTMLLPQDIAHRHHMTDGNIRHLDVTPSQFLWNRPAPGWGHRTPVPGLYLCGAGTHPGGEVTGANGYNAARVVMEDWVAQSNDAGLRY